MSIKGIIIIAISVLIGAAASYFYNRRKNPPIDKKVTEVINDPKLLLEKLKESGQIFDNDKDTNKRYKLTFDVAPNAETGKDEVVMNRELVKKEKEVAKPKTKKEKKKAVKKKTPKKKKKVEKKQPK